MKIVADDKIPYLKGLLEPHAEQVSYLPATAIDRAAVADARVLLTRTRTRCTRELLEGSRVEIIGTATIGTDHIDLDYCRHAGIEVVNAPGCNAPAVAQWVHATILQWMRAKNHDTRPTLGVVGAGHVGSIVARWGRELGYRVLVNDPPRAEREGSEGFSTLEQLQRECHIITFHTPLTLTGEHRTHHLCDHGFLEGLHCCRLLLNAARGAVCDTTALLDWHGDVAIDCWEGEPAINHRLLDRAFVATPHIAGYSLEGKQRGTAMIIDALNRRYGWDVKAVEAAPPAGGAPNVDAALIAGSYNPLADTRALREHPDHFEALRNSYTLRHEVTSTSPTPPHEH